MTPTLRAWAACALLLSACAPPARPPAPSAAPALLASSSAAPLFERAASPPPAPAPATAGLCQIESLPSPLVGPSDPSLGSPAAPVTLVLFDEFDHVFGRKMSRTITRLLSRYGPDRLRVVWKNYPLDFHPHARDAAVVGQAVLASKGQDAFWRYHDTLFSIGPLETTQPSSSLSLQDIRRAAREVGLDDAAVTSALADPDLQAKIDADLALVKALGASGAPHSFLNGVEISGAQSLETLSEHVDRELDEARKAQASPSYSCDRTRDTLASRPPPSDKTKTTTDTEVWKVPVVGSPARGSARALVTLVEFGGYQDPFSRRVEATLVKLREHYGDKLRIVWKDNPLPFQPMSGQGAQLAREILARKGVEAFWKAHDQLLSTRIDDTWLEQTARSAGLDWTAAQAVIDKKAHDPEIGLDQELADDLKASGTPHFFINGRRLVGAQSFETFQGIIDEQLAKAEAMVRGGKRPEAVYEAVIAAGKEPEPPARVTVAPPPRGAPSRGSAGAKVVIEEFGGFQDPFSVKVEETLKTLLSSYNGKVRLVWRNKPLPFHKDAQLSAEAAAEALAQKGPDGFWKMHDLLLSKQAEPDGLKQPALEANAAQLGLDVGKFREALASHRHAAAIEQDSKAADEAKITGTPTFVINGYKLVGAQSERKFRRLIDRALAEPARGKKK